MKFFLLKLKRVLLQLLLLLVCYFLSRCFFVLLNREHFSDMGLGDFLSLAAGATRFDISGILIVNALYIVLFFLPVKLSRAPRWERFTQLVFIVLNAIALLFEVSDWAYFRFTLKRATADVLNMITRKGDFLGILPHLLVDYWYIPLAGIAFIAGFIWVNRRICRATPLSSVPEPAGWGYWVLLVVQFLLVCPLIVVGIRGGITNLVPIGVKDAVSVGSGNFVPVVLNTPFSIINTLYADELAPVSYMPAAEAESLIHPIKKYDHISFRKKNVVVIIIESFSKEFTALGTQKGRTPFFDSLMQRSYICTNAYANGLHSAEGIPAVVAGIPTIMEEPFTTSVYGTNRITALPNVLKGQGYSSAFYHGGTNGTMSFNLFCANAGYDKYYGRSEYANEADYDGNWGIWDEPFFKYFAAGINKMRQPFLATIFSLSNHDPYHIPDKYKTRFTHKKERLEATFGYTDMVLRQFFEAAAAQPWFSNTLFVITADHSAVQHDDDYYAHNMGAYAIPIVFYAPGDSTLRGCDTNIAQQIDIMPSVLDYLGYGSPFFALGNSVFAPGQHYAVNELQGKNQLLRNGYLLQASGVSPSAFYAFPADSSCKNNVLQSQQDRVAQQAQYLRAFQQVCTQALINNKMWIRP